MRRRYWSAARLALWLPGSAGLCLVGWVWLWRVAPFAQRPPQTPGAILAGLLADLLMLFALVLVHRAIAAAEVRSRHANAMRLGVTAVVAAITFARALDVVSTEFTGLRLNGAFLRRLTENPQWFWGMRWLLLASLMSVPLTLWALRSDARSTDRAVVALGVSSRAHFGDRVGLAAACGALSILVLAVTASGAGAAGEMRIILSQLSWGE